MTLIVAQIVDQEVQIISDTQITHSSLGPTNPLNGQLKTVIITPFLSVSFSGQPYYAEKLIKSIYNGKVKNILVSALEANIKSDDCTHFIICVLKDDKPYLSAIRNRNVEQNIKAAYIGDAIAYKKYREFYGKAENENIFSKMVKAFEQVIDDESADTFTVGQFMTVLKTEIAASPKISFLGYQVNNLYMIGKHKLIEKFKGMFFIKNVDASEGGYSYSFLRGWHPGNPAYAIHFHVGGFGILFYPFLDYGQKEDYSPTIFINEPDGESFAYKIRQKYKLEMQGLVISKDGIGYKHIITEDIK